MIVCIAEKPSVARDIAAVLGATHNMHTYIEGAGYQVTWTYGHLCELKEPGDYTTMWQQWSLAALPLMPPRFGIKLKKDKGVEQQFNVIKQLMEKAEMIINCGDAGQEGELIQRWVMQKAGAKCPVKRLWISSLTEQAIRQGFQNLREEQDLYPLYMAGLCRAVGDWLLGINATRLYTMKYQRGKKLLSVGRVQTPTLALIVTRQHEIETFIPQTYYVLVTLYRNTLFTAVVQEDDENNNPNSRGFTNKQQALQALQNISTEPLTIKSVNHKKITEAPPRLFDLTSLQVECNKRFTFSAEHTLEIIQTLYEHKLTTYPRVDTTFLPDDMYTQAINILNNLDPLYHTHIQPLRGTKLKKSKKIFDTSKVTDHHAIIPTGIIPQNLTTDQQQVYDIVSLRFIAAFHPDCLINTTTVNALCADIHMKASGREILQPGWHTVLSNTTDDRQDKENSKNQLPDFKPNESGPHQPQLTEKQTTPPKPYTEATLLRAMETAGKFVDNENLRDALKENGIGRPSTRAAIIQTLLKRGYIKQQRRNLIPTTEGIQLITHIHHPLLTSVALTGMWERKLRLIEKQQYQPDTFIKELKEMVNNLVNTVLQEPTKQ